MEANNLLQLEQFDGRPLDALHFGEAQWTKHVKLWLTFEKARNGSYAELIKMYLFSLPLQMTLGPSTVQVPQEVSHPPEPVSSAQSDSLCSELEGYQLDVAYTFQKC